MSERGYSVRLTGQCEGQMEHTAVISHPDALLTISTKAEDIKWYTTLHSY